MVVGESVDTLYDCRPIHIAVVQGNEGLVLRILTLMKTLHLNIDVYNKLRQVTTSAVINQPIKKKLVIL